MGRSAPEDRPPDLLGLLAYELVGRVEALLDERNVESGPQIPERADDRWLKVSEVAEQVGACERTVYRALRSGALRGERLGSQWRVRPDAVTTWLAQPATRDAPSPVKRPPGPSRARSEGQSAFTARALDLQRRKPIERPTDTRNERRP